MSSLRVSRSNLEFTIFGGHAYCRWSVSQTTSIIKGYCCTIGTVSTQVNELLVEILQIYCILQSSEFPAKLFGRIIGGKII